MQKSFVIRLNTRLGKACLLKAAQTGEVIRLNGHFQLIKPGNFCPFEKCLQDLLAIALIPQRGIDYQTDDPGMVGVGV